MKRNLEDSSDDIGCSTPERVKDVTAITPKTADFNDFANTMLSPLQLQSPVIGSSGVNESRGLGSVWSPTVHNDNSGVSNEVFQFPVPKALASKRSINNNGFDTSSLHNHNDTDNDIRNVAFNFDNDDNSRRQEDNSSSSSTSSSSSSAMKDALLERARGLKTSPKNGHSNGHNLLYDYEDSSSSTLNHINGSSSSSDSSGFASLTMAAEELGNSSSNRSKGNNNINNNNKREQDKKARELIKAQSKLALLDNGNSNGYDSSGKSKYGMLSPSPSGLDVHGSHSTMSPQQVLGQQDHQQQQQQQQQQPNGMRTGPKCNCKKSRCLKLYCDCFRVQEYCFNCNCLDCANTVATDHERRDAMTSILERNKDAFKPRVNPTEGSGSTHLTGCHCKRSACLKKYCECFTGMVACSKRCNCLECKNTSDFLERRIAEMQLKGSKKSKSNSSSSSSSFMKNMTTCSQLIAPSVEQPHPELMNVNVNASINMNMNGMNSMSNVNVASNMHLSTHNIHHVGVSSEHSHQLMGNEHVVNPDNNNISNNNAFGNVSTSDMVKSFPDILPPSPTPSSPTPSSPKLILATKGQGFDISSNDLGSIARAVTELSSPHRLSQDDVLVNVGAPV